MDASMQYLERFNNGLDMLLVLADVHLLRLFTRFRRKKQTAANENASEMRMPLSLFQIKQTASQHSWLFLAISVIWFLGHLGFSFGWLLLGFLILFRKSVMDDKHQEQRASMRNAYRVGAEQTEAERKEFLAKLGDALPSWVFFGESERVEWLNTVIRRMWPHFNKFVAHFIMTNFAELLRKETPFALEFRKVDIGDEPLHICSVRSYNVENMARDEIIADVEVLYCGDAEFAVSAKALRIGVADLRLRGTLRVTLKPLLPHVPFIGCVTLAFINRPEIDFNLTDAADIAEKLGLYRAIRSAVYNVIESILVLPNRMPVPIPPSLHTVRLNEAYLKHPMPVGVLRVTIIEAKDLPTTDIAIGNMAKCDGFCELNVGNQFAKTRVIQDQSNPKWDESFDFSIMEKYGQPVQITVYDADAFGKKQRVGKLRNIDASDVANASDNVVDKWFHIYDTSRGKLHARLRYFNLSDSPDDFAAPYSDPDTHNTGSGINFGFNINLNFMRRSSSANSHARHRHCTTCALHTGLVYIYVHSAENLPIERHDSDPEVKVKISIEDENNDTQPVRGRNPLWDEVFHFLIENPLDATLVLQVVDKKHENRPLAIGSVKLNRVRDEPGMIWTHPIQLEHKPMPGAPETRLHLTVALRAMTVRKLDATAVADANDRFFLYGAPFAEEPQSSSNISRKKSKKSRSGRESASTTPSASMLRLDTQPRVTQTESESNEAGLTLRVPQITQNFSENSLTPLADQVQSTSMLPANSSESVDKKAVVLRMPSILRRAAVTEPTRPAQTEDSFVESDDAGAHGLGKIKLTLRYAIQRTSLTVVVHRCQNLSACDTEKHSSDPYVTLKLVLPGPSVPGRLQRSVVIKNNLNPTYDASFALPLPTSDVEDALLLVSVKHQRAFIFSKARKHIGDIALRLRDYDVLQSLAITAWFDLQPRTVVDSHGTPSLRNSNHTIDQHSPMFTQG